MKSGAQNFIQIEKNEGFERDQHYIAADSVDSSEHHNVISIDYEAKEWKETLVSFSK